MMSQWVVKGGEQDEEMQATDELRIGGLGVISFPYSWRRSSGMAFDGFPSLGVQRSCSIFAQALIIHTESHSSMARKEVPISITIYLPGPLCFAKSSERVHCFEPTTSNYFPYQ